METAENWWQWTEGTVIVCNCCVKLRNALQMRTESYFHGWWVMKTSYWNIFHIKVLMALCLHSWGSCQAAPVAQLPAEPQVTGVSVPAWVRTEHLQPWLHSWNESTAMAPMDHLASICSQIFLSGGTPGSGVQQYPGGSGILSESFCWVLEAHPAGSCWVQLHRHSCGLQPFPEDRTMSKIILPAEKLFFQSCAGTCIL